LDQFVVLNAEFAQPGIRACGGWPDLVADFLLGLIARRLAAANLLLRRLAAAFLANS
tara:strand:+ start:235 stop:405 length:171 start_codon:yes stop_codon:yes gene_type:complete